MVMILPAEKVDQVALVLVLTDKVEPLPRHQITRVIYQPMEAESEITMLLEMVVQELVEIAVAITAAFIQIHHLDQFRIKVCLINNIRIAIEQ